jgi:hypothetical protein
MGNKVSISFKKGEHESAKLFSHWGGKEFVSKAKEYARKLKEERKDESTFPLDRLDPSTVMVDFIREITHDTEQVEEGLYLPKYGLGDNSDNGHYVIDLYEITPLSELEEKVTENESG